MITQVLPTPGLKTGMDFRDPGLKTGVENDNYLVLDRVRVWRTGRHTDHGFPGFISHPRSCDRKKPTSTTTGATYEADLETLLAEPNTLYLIQNLVTCRARESPYNLRGNNKAVVP